jgi:hypothetical protein
VNAQLSFRSNVLKDFVIYYNESDNKEVNHLMDGMDHLPPHLMAKML